jgi:redox-sensitive bicupin YhaK (pirin superfamily)
MITTRTAKQCGQADFGWLQARYTFSFGHYFDPKLLGYASLRVLNQEVLAPPDLTRAKSLLPAAHLSESGYPEPHS